MKLLLNLLALPLALLAPLSFADSLPGRTSCEEWATMTQVLVLRWQGNNLPKKDGTQATAEDVKAALKIQMNGHPELPEALGWVDYAYKNKDGNPVHVWQAAKSLCEGGSI